MKPITTRNESGAEITFSYDDAQGEMVISVGQDMFVMDSLTDLASLGRMTLETRNEKCKRGYDGELERALDAIPQFFPDAYAVTTDAMYDPETGDLYCYVYIYVGPGEDFGYRERDSRHDALFALIDSLWPGDTKEALAPNLKITWYPKNMHCGDNVQ